MKIWLDDLREAPEGYTWCKSVNEAIKCIKSKNQVEIIDCDHDLGDYASDGGDAVKLLDYLERTKNFIPIAIHTMNPVGRANMERIIEHKWKNRSN